MTNCNVLGNIASDRYYGGGGAYRGTLYGCTVIGNRTEAAGGGGFGCTFNNCLIVSNSATAGPGAVSSSTLNNCTVVGHTNSYAAAYSSTFRNSIVYYNANNYQGGSFACCCTSPLAPGSGNFTNPPTFLDLAGGNLRLQANSPCINAGNNVYATDRTDLGGNPRIAGGTVDLGAYEYQSPASALSYAWAQAYGIPIDGTGDADDADHDGLNNWQEWRVGTEPTNAASALRLLSPVANLSGLVITWQSVNTRSYFLERAAGFGGAAMFVPLAKNLPGRSNTTSFTDTSATNSGPYFYRVGVQQ